MTKRRGKEKTTQHKRKDNTQWYLCLIPKTILNGQFNQSEKVNRWVECRAAVPTEDHSTKNSA